MSSSSAESSTAASILSRRIAKVYRAHSQKEGAGFVVNRPFPSHNVKDEETDPFLMLDEFGPKKMDLDSPGAPWHPHRGFDTVTYMKSGISAHQDSLGNKGLIQTGEVQWMRTGSGIIHDEGPPKLFSKEELRKMGYDGNGIGHGFQLWVNLPPELKMTPPSYHHLTQETFKWVPLGSRGEAKVFAGDLSTDTVLRKSPLDLSVPVLYADIVISAVHSSSEGEESTSEGGNTPTIVPIRTELDTCILYVYGGEGRVFDGDGDEAGTIVKRQDTVVYQCPTAGQQIKLLATSAAEGLKVILMAGKKIGAPIVRYGPFVMNTEDEIFQAMEDYKNGKLATVKGTDHSY